MRLIYAQTCCMFLSREFYFNVSSTSVFSSIFNVERLQNLRNGINGTICHKYFFHWNFKFIGKRKRYFKQKHVRYFQRKYFQSLITPSSPFKCLLNFGAIKWFIKQQVLVILWSSITDEENVSSYLSKNMWNIQGYFYFNWQTFVFIIFSMCCLLALMAEWIMTHR